MREAFSVETRVATGYGGMQLAIVFSLEWGNKQRRMYALSLKMHLQHDEMTSLDFLQPISSSKQLMTTFR